MEDQDRDHISSRSNFSGRSDQELDEMLDELRAGKIGIINQNSEAGWLPVIGGQQYQLIILVVAILTVLMFQEHIQFDLAFRFVLRAHG